jgi:hypothetical protein
MAAFILSLFVDFGFAPVEMKFGERIFGFFEIFSNS